MIAALALPSCTPTAEPATATTVDLNADLEALKALQAVEEEAHMTEQPALLVNMLNDTFCNIKNGEVKYFTKDEMTERFIKYFDSVEFVRWKNSSPQLYTISPDGMMAHILVQKEVELNDETGPKPIREKTNFAWTELWKKKEGRWKLYTVTSTENAMKD